MKIVKPSTDMWAVCDPKGIIVHTTICCKAEDAIREWIETEQTMGIIYNAARVLNHERTRYTASWEGFEAEGYTVEQVEIHPGKHHAEHV